jgi:hypothetical protein
VPEKPGLIFSVISERSRTEEPVNILALIRIA